MRDRLIELIQESVQGCARNWAEVIADHLLSNGVIVPTCKVGDNERIAPTADVVPKRLYDLAVKEREANVKGFTEEITRIKRQIAMEIFAEIEKCNRPPFPESTPVYIMKNSEFVELKKKYTDGERDELRNDT